MRVKQDMRADGHLNGAGDECRRSVSRVVAQLAKRVRSRETGRFFVTERLCAQSGHAERNVASFASVEIIPGPLFVQRADML